MGDKAETIDQLFLDAQDALQKLAGRFRAEDNCGALVAILGHVSWLCGFAEQVCESCKKKIECRVEKA